MATLLIADFDIERNVLSGLVGEGQDVPSYLFDNTVAQIINRCLAPRGYPVRVSVPRR